MDERARRLIEQGDHLFTKRQSLLSLWQEISDNFYVERADFVYQRNLGREFADQLMTSYPLLLRRDLGNSIGAMLRPKEKDWFRLATNRDERLDQQARQWLEYAGGVMRRAMYDRPALFTRATKEADHDFASFGQAVISIEKTRKNRLLYRCWHLRDCAWSENHEGVVDTLHRKWKPTARQVCDTFPDTVDPKVQKLNEEAPFTEIEVRHIVLPSAAYALAPGARKSTAPFVSIYVDTENGTILEEVPQRYFMYVVPRWQTVSGSQYAYSPATVCGLPDARLIQSMTLTLLEAGEKAASPPMLAIKEAIRSDIQLFAGGITYADKEYDQKLGDVLRPLTQDFRGMPLGIELMKDVREVLKECFFLNKLSLPAPGENPEMTAFEAGQRVQEYIRQALPLFEPLELEYNGAVCDSTFWIMFRAGAFGSPIDMPQSLRGADIQFRFQSPLSEAMEAQKGQLLGASKALLATVMDIDPSAPAILDAKVALRDALRGIGAPAIWLRSEQAVAKIDQAAADQQAQAQALAAAQQSANVVKSLGDAGQSAAAAAGQIGGLPGGAAPAPPPQQQMAA